jgi:hypothetical protein
MYRNQYVNLDLLSKGIYACSKPHLFDMNETIQSLINKAYDIQDKMGEHHFTDSYFKNLKQCDMVHIFICEENSFQKMLTDIGFSKN